ncbi:MAG: YebC/PmpR family DNA-binding transcriptional regulator [Elusimicrobiaceae bacterium]|nr:YebC/PmpR family DNA-binding transcriptional regulator [Elusimicrobiaceae bacterium]MBR2504760.1 YebC/PmpR family DNA-binding transcriptional regulator [Elusimicrobiaceae bacterium]MBR5608706.1 YebC/PmpR family DNA-binding transcriptional regulator [Elusimicrobiaceae bacterium]
MGGHSHWAGIKHKKALVDAKKGKVFTKILREITIAAKMSGGNPDQNPRLRKAMDDARAANMPSDNVKRAIMKGTGQLPGVSYEEITYEGYGPGSTAVIVECTTDNKNRTFAEIRKIFTSRGGSIGTSGCVSYMFKSKGVIVINKEAIGEEELMDLALEAGAEDVRTEGDVYEVLTAPDASFDEVKKAIEAKGITPESAELTKLPDTEVNISDEHTAESLMKMMDELDDHDDTKNVYSNYNIPDDIMAKLDK